MRHVGMIRSFDVRGTYAMTSSRGEENCDGVFSLFYLSFVWSILGYWRRSLDLTDSGFWRPSPVRVILTPVGVRQGVSDRGSLRVGC
jgi:hypothetical protein